MYQLMLASLGVNRDMYQSSTNWVAQYIFQTANPNRYWLVRGLENRSPNFRDTRLTARFFLKFLPFHQSCHRQPGYQSSLPHFLHPYPFLLPQYMLTYCALVPVLPWTRCVPIKPWTSMGPLPEMSILGVNRFQRLHEKVIHFPQLSNLTPNSCLT